MPFIIAPALAETDMHRLARWVSQYKAVAGHHAQYMQEVVSLRVDGSSGRVPGGRAECYMKSVNTEANTARVF